MSDGRPPPLTPAECTMGGNDWFPLAHRRLRKSKWWRRASDLARARNVMLWGEAYDAVPAGSLPDDDDELAEAAGFGMDVDAFLRHKDEIMAPWVLCSDGRWYHPTVCETVLETWEKQSAKRRADAERKARSRQRVKGAVTPTDGDVTRDSPQVTPEIGTQTETIRQTGQTADEELPSESPPQPREPGDWPDGGVSVWSQKLAALSSGRLNPDNEPGLVLTGGTIARWQAMGASFLLDVIPAVTALCRRQRHPITRWTYFDRAVTEAHHARTRVADPLQTFATKETADDDKLARKHANFERSYRAAARLAARGDGGGGGDGGDFG